MDMEEHTRIVDAMVDAHLEIMSPGSHVVVVSVDAESGTGSVTSSMNASRTISILKSAIKEQESRN